MKILKIVNSNDEGGVLTCETQFLTLLKNKGVHVDLVIVGNGKHLSLYKSLAVRFFQIPETSISFGGNIVKRVNSIFQSFLYGLKYARTLHKNIEQNYDAVIYRRENLMFLSGLLSNSLKTKCFWHMANSINSAFSKHVYNSLCAMLKIEPIANSEYTKNTIGSRCREVIYPGYDPQRITGGKQTYRDLYETGNTKYIFGMLTRIDEFKAVDIVINAFKKASLDDRAMLLIGGGPLDTPYANMIHELISGVENIKLIGRVQDVNNFYASVDVMINGRKNAEPFGITIAESLAAGTPVISYYKGGPSEMIQAGKNGWLVKEPTISAYTLAIKQAYEERSIAKQTAVSITESSNAFSAPVSVNNLIRLVDKRSQQ